MADTKKSLWYYDGKVMSFGRLVGEIKHQKTWAPTERKAVQNLCFSYKMSHGLAPTANVELAEKPVLLYKAS